MKTISRHAQSYSDQRRRFERYDARAFWADLLYAAALLGLGFAIGVAA